MLVVIVLMMVMVMLLTICVSRDLPSIGASYAGFVDLPSFVIPGALFILL